MRGIRRRLIGLVVIVVAVSLYLNGNASAQMAPNPQPQMPQIPNPMAGMPMAIGPTIPNPMAGTMAMTPLPPGVIDPESRVMPRIPVVVRPNTNLYSYADVNPTNKIDPKGTTAIPALAICATPVGAALCVATAVVAVCAVAKHEECMNQCEHLIGNSPSGDLQSSEFRKCYRECMGSL